MVSYNVYYSRPLDVHRLTDYQTFRTLLELLFSHYPCLQTFARQRSATKSSKGSRLTTLKLVLLDLYVCHLEDPELCLGISSNNNSWIVGSRYNTLHISRDIVEVVKELERLGLVEVAPHWHDSNGNGASSRTKRYKATTSLSSLFDGCSLTLVDLSFNPAKETILLRSADVDEDGEPLKGSRLLEYEDTPETLRMREHLIAYNQLLQEHHIDVADLEEPVFEKTVWNKKAKRHERHRVQIGQHNKHVHRVFSRGSFDMNGRFYGGWWMQLPEEVRAQIVIDGNPTIEVDYKAIHPHLLASVIGIRIPVDPYTLTVVVIDELSAQEQRAWMKALILQCINAKSRNAAFGAFRDKAKAGTAMKHAKNKQLNALLDAFVDHYPAFEPYLCSDWGIKLMRKDSELVEMVVGMLTKKGIPVLTVHDSFIVQTHHFVELRIAMSMASIRVAGKDLFAEQDGFEVDRTRGLDAYKYTAIRSKYKAEIGYGCEARLKRFSRQRGMIVVREPVNRGFIQFFKCSLNVA